MIRYDTKRVAEAASSGLVRVYDPAIAHVALATYGNLVTRAGNVPNDGSSEDARLATAA